MECTVKIIKKKVLILHKTRFGDAKIKQKEKMLDKNGTYIINRGDLLLDKNPRSKVVYQYSLDGNFIKSWNCVKIAAIELGIYYDSIIYACNGKRKTAGKYKWKYETK